MQYNASTVLYTSQMMIDEDDDDDGEDAGGLPHKLDDKVCESETVKLTKLAEARIDDMFAKLMDGSNDDGFG